MKMSEAEAIQYLADKSAANRFEYKKITDGCVKFLNYPEKKCFINFILTARGRVEFTEPMFNSFEAARKNFGKEICFTLVEHSETPTHSKFYRKKPVNYAYIPASQGEQFNKCLSYNIGTLLAPECDYFLFHDLDILVRDNFFNGIIENINRTKSRALQCYTKRRVLNCDPSATSRIIGGELDINILKEGDEGINLPMYNGKPSLGSKGGSILLEKELFFEVGGYDPELFRAYSAEDNFFWEKVSAVTDISYADDPPIELFHMWHEPQFGKNPFLFEMERDYLLFTRLSAEGKRDFIKQKRNLFA